MRNYKYMKTNYLNKSLKLKEKKKNGRKSHLTCIANFNQLFPTNVAVYQPMHTLGD